MVLESLVVVRRISRLGILGVAVGIAILIRSSVVVGSLALRLFGKMIAHSDRVVGMVGMVARLASLRILLKSSLMHCYLLLHHHSPLAIPPRFRISFKSFLQPGLLRPLSPLLWTVIERLVVTPTTGPLVVMREWRVMAGRFVA